jgi:hypothetical protein
MSGLIVPKGSKRRLLTINNAAIDQTGDDVVRNIGLTKIIKDEASLAEALKDPPAYAAKRSTALTALSTKIQNTHKDNLKKFLDQGLPNSDALAYANAIAQATTDAEVALINLEYPGNLINQTLNNIGNIQNADRKGQLSMIQSTSGASVGRRGRPKGSKNRK